MIRKIKSCCTCRRSKKLVAFGKNAAMRDGLNKQCRVCANAFSRKLRLADRLACLSHYGGYPPKCKCCGETRWEFLSIDHENGGGKAHISAIGFNLVRWLRKNGYPKGFRVLCHNCNFSIGHYGYCPHKRKSTLFEEAHGHSRKRGGNRWK